MIPVYKAYEKGDNPLWVYDGKTLQRVREFAELYDVSVDAAGGRMAFCYWENGERHIEVREINL